MTQLLLFGEGDFSFAQSLTRGVSDGLGIEDIGTIPILATSLDSREELIDKYPSFVYRRFDSRVKLLHKVNALDKSVWEQYVDAETVVIWNHPHLGVESALQHYQLLCHFFNLADVFNPKSIILSFLAGQLERWRVREAANRSGFEIEKGQKLIESDFPGFECRRNLSGGSFKTSKNFLQSWFLWFEKNPASVFDISSVMNEPASSAYMGKFFPCKQCDRIYSSMHALKTHVSQIHELQKFQIDLKLNLVCCEKVFDSQYAIDMHNRSVHGEHEVSSKKLKLEEHYSSSDEFLCGVCGSTDKDHLHKFGSNRAISTLLKCSICEKEFKDRRALNQHLNYKHNS
jgi:hypothetical protein